MATWKFDAEHSELMFRVRHLMITTTTGSFLQFSVTMQAAEKPFHQACFKMNAEVDSIDTRDQIRDDHLKNADFFDVKRYPQITFESTGLKKKTSSDEYSLQGILTIKGTAKSVEFTLKYGGIAKDAYANEYKMGFTVLGEIDRRDWDISFYMPLETGGIAVGNKISVWAEVEFKRVD